MLNELATIKILSDQIKEHGSPHDRGMADSYYGRGGGPSTWTGTTTTKSWATLNAGENHDGQH